MEWWDARAPRERILLLFAAGLLLLVLAVQLIAMPLFGATKNARAANMVSAQNLDAVTAGLAKLSSNPVAGQNTPTAQITGNPRGTIVNLARQRGLNVARVGNNSSGSLTVSIEGASPQLVFVWLGELQAQYGIEPVQANLVADSAGLVSASLTFPGSGTDQ